jgi:hypothetical protein
MIDASWIVIDRRTGSPICELFNQELVMMIDLSRYQIKTIRQHLADLNRR